MTELLTTLALVFIAAGPFVLIANRFSLPSAPFLIVAGIAVGGFFDEAATIELARYGIALLVFVFGTRIRFDAVRVVLGDSELVAIAQLLLVGSIGTGIGVVMDIPIEQSMLLGLAATFSSTLVGTAMIRQDIRDNLVHGRLAESIHYVQDIIAIVVLLVLGAGSFAVEPIAVDVLYGATLLLAAGIMYRWGFAVLEWASRGSEEALLITIIGLLVTFLGAAEALGISIVVGAFAAGLAVHHDPVRHLGVFNGLESIKDFFVTILFVTIGALVSIPTGEVLFLALVLVVLMGVLKPLISLWLLLYEGYDARAATLTSLNLDQASEFSLIIAIEALVLGILVQPLFDAIILGTAVTMITSGLTHSGADRIFDRLAEKDLLTGSHGKIDERSNVPADLSEHVIIAGYGRQGRRLSVHLASVDQPHVVIEDDPLHLETLRTRCDAWVFGDALAEYTWEKAGLAEAALVVSTIPSRTIADRLLGLAEETDVIVRADDSARARTLLDDGATYAYVDDRLAAARVIEIIEAIDAGDRSVDDLRERERRALAAEARSSTGHD